MMADYWWDSRSQKELAMTTGEGIGKEREARPEVQATIETSNSKPGCMSGPKRSVSEEHVGPTSWQPLAVH
jgi:hypothetical protein